MILVRIRRFFIMIMAATCSVAHLWAQESEEKERVKLSGQVMFFSSTNSNLTGGFFNDMPAIRGFVTVSKGGFALGAGRNSDLIEPKSPANVTIFMPSYTKTFGNYGITIATEIYLFDQFLNLDIIAPSIALSRKGAINLELFATYGWCFQGEQYDNLLTQRLAISKDYAGYTFKLTGWNVNWGTHRNAVSFEISKNLTDRLRIFVSGNVNHNYDADLTQKFGVVRLAYSF